MVSHFPEEGIAELHDRVMTYSVPKGPLCVGRVEEGGITFLKVIEGGQKNHGRNFVSYINQAIYPQEKPHLNSSRQIKISNFQRPPEE